MKQTVTTLIAIIAVIALSSCVTSPVSLTSSTTPIHDRAVEEKLGQSDGSSTAYSVLGLWMIGRPDIGAAVKEALDKKEADALIDVRCYETWVWYVIFSRTTITVEGEAVRLSKPGGLK